MPEPVSILDTALRAGGAALEASATAYTLLERLRPDACDVRDGVLHVAFDLHADDGAPASDDLLRLLQLQLMMVTDDGERVPR
jgi:hypothetical protein